MIAVRIKLDGEDGNVFEPYDFSQRRFELPVGNYRIMSAEGAEKQIKDNQIIGVSNFTKLHTVKNK